MSKPKKRSEMDHHVRYRMRDDAALAARTMASEMDYYSSDFTPRERIRIKHIISQCRKLVKEMDK